MLFSTSDMYLVTGATALYKHAFERVNQRSETARTRVCGKECSCTAEVLVISYCIAADARAAYPYPWDRMQNPILSERGGPHN